MADLKGEPGKLVPPLSPDSFIFKQFSAKSLPSNRQHTLSGVPLVFDFIQVKTKIHLTFVATWYYSKYIFYPHFCRVINEVGDLLTAATFHQFVFRMTSVLCNSLHLFMTTDLAQHVES